MDHLTPLTLAELESQSLTIDDIVLDDVNKYDIWDVRECAVANPEIWAAACDAYKSTKEFNKGIPHIIHQIWIGKRQPPCVWLDTWRVDFMTQFANPQSLSPQKPWTYKLWDNQSVSKLFMQNSEIFEMESAPQCQADILRLELLYQYGGVYIDADIVSTKRDLRPVITSKKALETGFVITYEPDTKDKPYSILGNSIIAATPKHPLTLMLMAYIKQVYHYKRPYYGVEWVTGPLTYKKTLVDTCMPIHIPPSEQFYPAFHYVPNPSAIDLDKIDAYCFQFGYTCSGLSQWVEQNNRCRRAHECSYHREIEYPLGKLRQFPKNETVDDDNDDGGGGNKTVEIPKVIHQLSLHDDDDFGPERWTNTWSDDFCQRFGFSYEKWTWNRLRDEIGEFFCANLYTKRNTMNEHAIKLLALEIINARGGYYVPLSTTFCVDEIENENNNTKRTPFDIEENTSSTLVFQTASVFGACAGTCVQRIKQLYQAGKLIDIDNEPVRKISCIREMNFNDHVTAMTSFKKGSRYLGAGEIHAFLKPNAIDAIRAVLTWGYDCQVPVIFHETTSSSSSSYDIPTTNHRTVFITNEHFASIPSIANELPGVLYHLDETNTKWDYIILNAEWEADRDGIDTYVLTCPFRAPNAEYIGWVSSSSSSSTSPATIEQVLSMYDKDSTTVLVMSLKSIHGRNLATMYSVMPKLQHASNVLTHGEYVPCFDREHEEIMDDGKLLKGFKYGQVSFELQSHKADECSSQVKCMFRSWENCSINCECRFAVGVDGIHIEFLRVFRDGHVVHDIANEIVS